MLTVPLKAIECFEKYTGSKLSYYVYSPVLSRALHHTPHRDPVCKRIKFSNYSDCTLFDGHYLRSITPSFPNGFVKICHAGICEAVMPVSYDGKLLGLLIAGIYVPVDDLSGISAVIRGKRSEAQPDLTGIKTADSGELQMLIEALQQLRARLEKWYREFIERDPEAETLTTKEKALWLIHRNALSGFSLQELAAGIHLSYGRTSHLIKELTGVTFSQYITQLRLSCASNMLVTTNWTVAVIAAESGFKNLVNFHKAFKKQYGESPADFRRRRVLNTVGQ